MTSRQAYVGTAQRTFSKAIIHLLETSYRLLGSGRVLELIAHDVKELAEQFYPLSERLQSGWMVFTGVKATGPKAYPGQPAADHDLVTLAWPVLLPEDLEALATRPKGKGGRQARQTLLRQRITRIVEYGWQHPQGPVLLTLADLAAMLSLDTVQVSTLLQAARKATGKPLLTKGYYFDQGMRPTHKDQIIALYEAGVDEADIARQSQHQPTSVGKYIRDYERVKLLLKNQNSAERIAYITGLQPNVVNAYIGMVHQYHPDLAPEQVSPAQT
jgi:DNA-binding CsgD family transcriptional regulator